LTILRGLERVQGLGGGGRVGDNIKGMGGIKPPHHNKKGGLRESNGRKSKLGSRNSLKCL